MNRNETLRQMAADWKNNPRWDGLMRTYTPEDVLKLHGKINIAHSLAHLGAENYGTNCAANNT